MIRQATIEDIPTLLGFGRSFFDESGYAHFIEWSDSKLEESFAGIIESPEGVILMHDGGFIGCLLFEMIFSRDVCAQELFWWVAPGYRRTGLGESLRQALEAWAKDAGARNIYMSTLDHCDPERVSHKFTTAGYTPAERSFIRSL